MTFQMRGSLSWEAAVEGCRAVRLWINAAGGIIGFADWLEMECERKDSRVSQRFLQLKR